MDSTDLKDKPVAKKEHWSQTEKDNLKSNYGCEIILTNVTLKEAMTGKAPTDAHVITYEVDDKVTYDLTRGSRTDLFDMYYDKFKKGLKSIAYGSGNIKPNLWGYRTKDTKGKKRK